MHHKHTSSICARHWSDTTDNLHECLDAGRRSGTQMCSVCIKCSECNECHIGEPSPDSSHVWCDCECVFVIVCKLTRTWCLDSHVFIECAARQLVALINATRTSSSILMLLRCVASRVARLFDFRRRHFVCVCCSRRRR